MVESDGSRGKGHRRKTWWDCVKNDMESFDLSQENAHHKNQWRKKMKGGDWLQKSDLLVLLLLLLLLLSTTESGALHVIILPTSCKVPTEPAVLTTNVDVLLSDVSILG